MSTRRLETADPLTAWHITTPDGRRLRTKVDAGSEPEFVPASQTSGTSRRADRYSDEWLIAGDDRGLVIRNVLSGASLPLREGFGVGPATAGQPSSTAWRIEPADPRYPVPEPQPLSTGSLIVGAQMCNLWMGNRWPKDRPYPNGREPVLGWSKIQPYPDRMPVIGWYDEGTPTAIDWEIRMAVESGITFFMPCWYRTKGNAGQPVSEELAHWMHGLPAARYRDRIRYFLMWENLNDIACGVSGERDLLENVMPFLIETYFRDDSYLKIDGCPLLSVYGPVRLIEELGGPEAARRSFERASTLCRRAGFEGLTLIGQYCWGSPAERHVVVAQAGFACTMSYHWPTFADGVLPEPAPAPSPSYGADDIIRGHETCWREQERAALSNIVTASVGWDSAPWDRSVTERFWMLGADDFGVLLERARVAIAAKARGGLPSQMLLLDNWNEFGEGHYLMPTVAHGFTYLDAVAKVFGRTDPRES